MSPPEYALFGLITGMGIILVLLPYLDEMPPRRVFGIAALGATIWPLLMVTYLLYMAWSILRAVVTNKWRKEEDA